MSLTVWLLARTLKRADAAGHFWVYLNWALGLRALGCRVVWIETVAPSMSALVVQDQFRALQNRLQPYGLIDSVALCPWGAEPLRSAATGECLDLEAAREADLLLNMAYGIPPPVVRLFRRSALLDIDPGLTQIWLSKGQIGVPRHDVYFTIGETVGQPGTPIPDCGLAWQYTPPCVALDWWQPSQSVSTAPFTTVSSWRMKDWVEDEAGGYPNDKRSGFLPFLDLPSRTKQGLELALHLAGCDDESAELQERGWRVREAHEVASTPADYMSYIQGSRGEFSCVKPSCVLLQNAWISDRTLCYLASGKPAVVQHTGPSRFLPDSAGLFRFRDLEEATRCLDLTAVDYDYQCKLARTLTEEYFDARKVVGHVLERALA